MRYYDKRREGFKRTGGIKGREKKRIQVSIQHSIPSKLQKERRKNVAMLIYKIERLLPM
jgi:hypothetical protein